MAARILVTLGLYVSRLWFRRHDLCPVAPQGRRSNSDIGEWSERVALPIVTSTVCPVTLGDVQNKSVHAYVWCTAERNVYSCAVGQ